MKMSFGSSNPNLRQPSIMSYIILPHVLITNTVTFNCSSSVSVQITTVRNAIKTDCGVGVAAVGNTCFHILDMVGDT
jgi:hypothetical protein